MSEHKMTLSWKSDGSEFSYKSYTRNHTWEFSNGVQVGASAAAAYLGDPDQVDPEQAFVASLSSCHMLTFLAICAMKNITVESYIDKATGYLEKGDSGKPVLARVELHPRIVFGGPEQPSHEELVQLHDKAHHECFLANSVKTEIRTIMD
jgi:organic hydroperoxide reductase OsmC/OhrA